MNQPIIKKVIRVVKKPVDSTNVAKQPPRPPMPQHGGVVKQPPRPQAPPQVAVVKQPPRPQAPPQAGLVKQPPRPQAPPQGAVVKQPPRPKVPPQQGGAVKQPPMPPRPPMPQHSGVVKQPPRPQVPPQGAIAKQPPRPKVPPQAAGVKLPPRPPVPPAPPPAPAPILKEDVASYEDFDDFDDFEEVDNVEQPEEAPLDDFLGDDFTAEAMKDFSTAEVSENLEPEEEFLEELDDDGFDEQYLDEGYEQEQYNEEAAEEAVEEASEEIEDEDEDLDYLDQLKEEEANLYSAYKDTLMMTRELAVINHYQAPNKSVSAKNLIPKLNPAMATIIKADMYQALLVFKALYPQFLGRVTGKENDQKFFAIAESAKDEILQEFIFNFVQVDIEIEACKLRSKAGQIAKESKILKEEAVDLFIEKRDLANGFIKKLKRRNLPINEEALINNYLRMADVDSNKAYRTLITNPAFFSPIIVEKMPKKFFGLIKPNAKDGIIMNKKIGSILKNLMT